jgi:hypothetical protein
MPALDTSRAQSRASSPAVTGESSAQGRGSLLGNQAVLQMLLGKAAEQVDGTPDFDAMLGLSAEDKEGKYNFPSGPGDAPGTVGARVKQPDALPALRDKHAANTYADVKDGAAFVQGTGDAQAVDPNDVAQGALGDCYWMAGMAAVARANPEAIQKLIKDNGNGTFDVTLYVRQSPYGKPTPVTKTVDAQLPTKTGSDQLYAKSGDKDGKATELWPALLEKTLAQHKGSYETIQGESIAKGFQFHGSTELLTGKTEGYKAVSSLADDDVLLELAAALESKKPVTVDSSNMEGNEDLSKEANAVNVYGNHAYAVESVDLDKGTITLQNPWGSHHVDKLPIASFRKFYRGIRIGG